MGGTVGGAAGGTGLCRAQVRWFTGCAGIAVGGTSTIGACGRSTLAGFLNLVSDGCTLGGRRSSHLSFLLGWGGRQLLRCGVSGPVVERVLKRSNSMYLIN